MAYRDMNFRGRKITVNKEDYEVFEFMSGYFGICQKGRVGGNCIYGGDSANEDDYNENHMNNMYDMWDGTLYYDKHYGYLINE